jgi:hypothetical protein
MFEIEMANGFQSDWELDTLDEAKAIQGAVMILEFDDDLDIVGQYDLVDGEWIEQMVISMSY